MQTIEKKYSFRDFVVNQGIIFILLLICLVLVFLTPDFLQVNNLINIVRQVAITGTIAFGMTMIIITDGIDLSAGSVVALAGVIGASFVTTADGATPNLLLGVSAAIGVGLLCGFINGSLVAFAKIPAFIATLGMQQAARGFATMYTEGATIGGFPEEFTAIGQGEVAGIPVPIIIYVFLGVLVHLILRKTRTGKHIYAVGGSEQAAVVCGINTKKLKLCVYTAMGFFTGIASLIMVSRVSSANPSAGLNFEFDAITATVIGGASLSGGTGSIVGTIIGSLIVGVVNNGLSLLGVSVYWQQVVKGLLIVGAVLLDSYKHKLNK